MKKKSDTKKWHATKHAGTIRLIKMTAIAFLLSGLVVLPSFSQSSPAEVLEQLKAGNQRYVTGNRSYPNQGAGRLNETATNGQHPYATIIACSDSRVPVEHIFDAGIGDIFVIRVAGNVVDADEAGSIEYGIGHLHTPVLVVLGHTHCGAVTAVARGDEVHGNIPELVDNIIPAVNEAKMDHGLEFTPALLEASIENNVWKAIEDLFEKSHEAVKLVREKKVKIVGAVYNLHDGNVNWMGEHPHQHKMIQD